MEVGQDKVVAVPVALLAEGVDRNSLEQYADLQQALQIIGAKYKPDQMETFGNTNKTGNRIYMVVKEWAEQKKSRSG